MAISRGSIHHSIKEDLVNLARSLFDVKSCKRASVKVKEETRDNISSFFDARNSILTPYARTSLYAILKALKLPLGSEILMTPFNISPMLDVIEELGLKPVFIDVNTRDFGPNYKDLEKFLKRKPSCFLLTYLFGYVPDVEYIFNCCRKYDVPVIEDISQNIGSKYKGKYLGKFGVASIYSASLTKFVDAYNGSFILTENDALAQEIIDFTEGLKEPKSKRLQIIIFKTLVYNVALSISCFSICVYPLLFILKILRPRIFYGLTTNVKPNIRMKILPAFYFEDITKIQCRLISEKLKSLLHLIRERREKVKRIVEIIKDKDSDYFKNNLAHLIGERNDYTYWQLLIKVKDTNLAQRVLFENSVETGITNLPNLSSFYNIRLNNSNMLKEKHIFLPIHENIPERTYKKLVNILIDRKLID